MTPLKLTMLGEFVNRHSVMTPPDYWRKLLKEVDRVADEDGDWPLMLTERARGMLELIDRYYQITNKVTVVPCEATDGDRGTCTRPRGHVNVFIERSPYNHCEVRDGRVWAEWRGPCNGQSGSSAGAGSE